MLGAGWRGEGLSLLVVGVRLPEAGQLESPNMPRLAEIKPECERAEK